MITVNGKPVEKAPVTIIVAPYTPMPNLMPGYYEHSRVIDGTGATIVRCLPIRDAAKLGEQS